MNQKKIKVGISACLLGLKYRYDGTSKTNYEIIEALKDKVDFIPVCPEVESGLPIPRPPMRLESSPKGCRMKVIENGDDVTESVAEWAETKLEQLEARELTAFILKARSPSCGLRSARLFSSSGKCLSEKEQGIFARKLRKKFPDMFIFEDEDFATIARILEEEFKKLL